MDLSEFDIILGLGWLTQYKAEVRCAERIVKVETKSGHITIPCLGAEINRTEFWSFLEVTPLSIEKIPVVKNYADVFEEVENLPPQREIEFRIDLIPNARPVVHPIRRMAPKEKRRAK